VQEHEDQAVALYDQARIAESNMDFVVAETLLKQIIADYSDTKMCAPAAEELLNLVQKFNQNYQALEIYYKTFPELRDDPRISKVADYLAAWCNIKQGDYEEAITYFESIILDPQTLPDSIFAVIDAGYTYLLLASNTEKAAYTGDLAWLKPKSMQEFITKRDQLLDKLMGETTIESVPEVPVKFDLAQNYPNPFNPSTTISYSIPKESKVSVNIYNLKGQLVKKLYTGNQVKGTHKLEWDGKNDQRKLASSGIYLIRIDYMGKSLTRKALMLK
jgi:tetratricopeptide (TPR) repeat protein